MDIWCCKIITFRFYKLQITCVQFNKFWSLVHIYVPSSIENDAKIKFLFISENILALVWLWVRQNIVFRNHSFISHIWYKRFWLINTCCSIHHNTEMPNALIIYKTLCGGPKKIFQLKNILVVVPFLFIAFLSLDAFKILW